MLGSNLVAQIVFEPSDSICAAKDLFRPWMIDTMKTTVMTPTLTPRMVSAERSLFERTVSSAIKADSRMSTTFISLNCPSAPYVWDEYHSALSASIGSRRAARQAGQRPLITPTIEETPTP